MKSDCGIILVIPPSAVEEGQEVDTKIEVVALKKSEIELPPNVDPVSCYYKVT